MQARAVAGQGREYTRQHALVANENNRKRRGGTLWHLFPREKGDWRCSGAETARDEGVGARWRAPQKEWAQPRSCRSAAGSEQGLELASEDCCGGWGGRPGPAWAAGLRMTKRRRRQRHAWQQRRGLCWRGLVSRGQGELAATSRGGCWRRQLRSSQRLLHDLSLPRAAAARHRGRGRRE